MDIKNKDGFTLIELIIVMIIISILAGLATVMIKFKAMEARDACRIVDMDAVRKAMAMSCQDEETITFVSNSSLQPNICKITGSSYLDFSTIFDPSVAETCDAATSGCSSDTDEVCDYAFGDVEDIVLINGNEFTAIPSEIDPCNFIVNFNLEDSGNSYIDENSIVLAEAEAEAVGENFTYSEGFVSLGGYNQIVYVDEVSGSDFTGTGSESNPYATFDKAYEDIITNNNQAIYLQEGEYICSVDDTHLKVMDVIGEGKDTTLFFDHSTRWIEGANRMYSLVDVVFYKLIFKTEVKGNNLFYGDDTVFYNVAFDLQGGNSYSINTPGSNFYNCVDITSPPLFLHGTHLLQNSYGRFFPGNGTNYSDYTIVTSIITHPDIDYNFHILDDGWENTGTGTNPDASQAHIGVYGGTYAWGE